MTTATDLPRMLAGTKLFGLLGDADRQTIAKQMRSVSYDNGQLIFARGDEGADVYLLTAGRVRLSVFTNEGRELAFPQCGAGRVLRRDRGTGWRPVARPTRGHSPPSRPWRCRVPT